ncbi:hypothetical protein EMIHUDRAFT_435421 [Emiliania huxleyi CCMP1516]|uniref:Uncharacterized protein n=2 Tax=Emiliania huxleyi TaxID=2903 RepID=A0A0D3JMA6_EMIH1|nr:hypothetical protein EMIHUDRAFT_435421 [Emiliania huxleyi CCMP1516]EOD24641.1 hypothetical protein EMIHUDRAFT_435421 [Emiliania huxleyi CCMP1516]|mmetsp:Transcript_17239/g.55649  ORF Transcript_17239/g.55649 Transcript_17239/m.55649 type:complete len:184 (+) Transcript_17239:314-865(+)|eukprot:XP_005777070.1 hypothetical protein EMIHUDRAFT_435421 [Emiliania huxleyi CCMP1516]
MISPPKSLERIFISIGKHSTGGSIQTLKWSTWDPDSRVAHLEVFGGYGGSSHTGQWTEPPGCLWLFLINLGRCCDYSYRFEFSEDYRRAEILIEANLCCCCCLPIPPCLPAWFVLPGSCVRFEAIQADEGSNDGTDWVRQSSICGGDFSYTYNLVEVYQEDGSPGRFHADLATYAPASMMISR